jgi:mono/diheme cytochrome c family protein
MNIPKVSDVVDVVRQRLRASSVLTLASLLIGLPGLMLHAEPLVPGFERFHAAEPSVPGGRLLYNELGCINCHGGDGGLPKRRGPELAGITQRIQGDWLRAFLSDPAAVRAGTVMPHLLSGQKPGEVESVLQYLATLKSKPEPKTTRDVNVERGRELFHTVGCVACHTPDTTFQPPEGAPKAADFSYPSVPFPRLGEKYVLTSLAEFLRDPLRLRPDGRMPRIEMEETDRFDLAGYLLELSSSDPKAAPKLNPFVGDVSLVSSGKQIVASARCASCHGLPEEVAVQPVPLRQMDGGCLAEAPTPGVPRYGLSGAQRSALKHFLAAGKPAESEPQTARLSLEALNCLACHERDGSGGPDAGRRAYFQGDHNLGDTGRYAPPLTGIGRKLQPEWFAKVLSGEARVRPYLHTKMPVYGGATDVMPTLLGRVDAKVEPTLPGGDDTAGRKLLGTQGGVNCITCHRWGAHASLGIQALDLSNIGQRLQPGWFREYLINPAGYRPGTLMPSFWPGGHAANQEILGGDTDRQIASIYSFAKSANGEPEGFPSAASGEFELLPKTHPVVLRTFLEKAGTHAILVGFPQGSHLAYDGKASRPALAWQGKFFDAYTTWFSRFAPFEKPLGQHVVIWPQAAPEPGVRFEGYRLDEKRVPVFLLNVGGVRVSDRFEAVEGGLVRSVVWDPARLKNFSVTHPDGVAVTEHPDSTPGARRFNYSWK